MEVTGYTLRAAVHQHELRRDTALRAFTGSLRVFPGETKESPTDLMDQFSKAERAIARLQVAQMRYNLKVKVKVDGEEISLAEAIKLVGGLGRTEKMWKTATGPKEDRYSTRSEDQRDPSQVYSQPTISVTEAVRRTAAAGKKSGAMRQAIAIGNSQAVEVEDLETSLFE